MKQSLFSINPRLDPLALRSEFAAKGRIHIPDFLQGDTASQLQDFLAKSKSWKVVMNSGDKIFEIDRKLQADIAPTKMRQIEQAIHAQARHGFQFCYETIRVPDADRDRRLSGTIIDEFARFLSRPPALEFFQILLGDQSIAFADAQATAYGPGHLLTAHDDAVAGKNRKAAFVMNLSQDWSADWGGLLTFHNPGKGEAEALIPSFNAMNFFKVPQLHSVTMVAPFVPRRRYSITGWFRAGMKP